MAAEETSEHTSELSVTKVLIIAAVIVAIIIGISAISQKHETSNYIQKYSQQLVLLITCVLHFVFLVMSASWFFNGRKLYALFNLATLCGLNFLVVLVSSMLGLLEFNSHLISIFPMSNLLDSFIKAGCIVYIIGLFTQMNAVKQYRVKVGHNNKFTHSEIEEILDFAKGYYTVVVIVYLISTSSTILKMTVQMS